MLSPLRASSFQEKEISQKELNIWMTATSIISGIIVYFFQGKRCTYAKIL